MKNEDPETYYLDNDKWIRLLEYIEEDGQIMGDKWNKYVNYSYSRPKLEKKITEFFCFLFVRPLNSKKIP